MKFKIVVRHDQNMTFNVVNAAVKFKTVVCDFHVPAA